MSAFTLARRRPMWHWIALGLALLALGLMALGRAAQDHPELADLLTGLAVISRIGWGMGVWLALFYYAFRGRTVADDRVAVANSLADMLEMDIPLDEALQHQVYELEHRFTSHATPLARALPRVLRSVRQGSSLPDAVGTERTFPTSWRPILQASQSQGSLVPGLRTLARLEGGGGIVDAGTLVRVFVTLSMLGILGTFLSLSIAPTFVTLFKNMDYPEHSMAFLQVGRSLVGPSLFVMVLLCIPAVQRLLGTVLGYIPGVGRFVHLQEQHQVCNALAGALDLGLPLSNAFRLASQACRTTTYTQAFQRTTPGDGLAQALERHPHLFDRTLRWMVASAERLSTPLPEVLQAAAEWFEEEGERQRKRVSVVISIAMSLATGAAVAALCITMMGCLAHIVTGLLQRGIMP